MDILRSVAEFASPFGQAPDQPVLDRIDGGISGRASDLSDACVVTCVITRIARTGFTVSPQSICPKQLSGPDCFKLILCYPPTFPHMLFLLLDDC